MEEAERAEAMVDGDDHAVGKTRHLFAVHADRIARPRIEAAAVKDHDDRLFRIRIDLWCPQIEREIVFPHSRRIAIDHDEIGIDMAPVARDLRGDIGPVERIANTRPRFDRLRRHEAVLARRIGRIADPAEDRDATRFQTAKLAAGRFDHREHRGPQSGFGHYRCAKSQSRSQSLPPSHHVKFSLVLPIDTRTNCGCVLSLFRISSMGERSKAKDMKLYL